MPDAIGLFLAISLRILVNPLANVIQKQLTVERNHPLVVNFLTYFFLSIPCLLWLLLTEKRELPFDFWLYAILGGLVGGLGNGFLVKALQKGDLSVLGPINAYKSVVGIITGILLLGEFPNTWGLAGIALIIYGSYFVLDTTEERFSWSLLKQPAIQYRIGAMVLTAVEAVFVKKVIQASDTNMAMVSWCCFGGLFSLVFLLSNRINLKASIRRLGANDYRQFFFLVLCIGLMQYTTNYAFDHMPVGYVLSLFQLSAIVSVWLGHKIFQEKDIRKKLLGSIIMIIGSVLIILMKDQ
ncbi:DMT family transporter [Flavihumibacter rivuli]|uniref:DMT family transporter n=1 Tax=Flavihumibacter rivuli TaxID=2838156 RepID=UPI001BDDD73E|nr:DMT family transporter [Flavihumibacter rivuli]ULQ57767.1 DMT family transporter [Flavihumibacter rivuli]